MPYLTDELIFVVMIFITVFLLAQSLVTPVFGENRRAKRRLKRRLKQISESFERPKVQSLLREKYLRKLAPWERRLESLPGMSSLVEMQEQAGIEMPGYRFVLLILVTGAVGGAAGWVLFHLPLGALAIAVLAGSVPILRMYQGRAKRINEFEEQLPDALSIMVRALRAGHPFTGTMQLVADEMEGPVAREFGLVFTDINYGGDVRAALLGLLQRVPSVTVMALVTAIMIQRESGGNLAEILDKLIALVRGRFRFQRQIRTYSAQGRMSAWVLVLIPFAVGGALTIVTPEYLPMLTKDPVGRKLLMGAFVMLIVGIIWIRKIVRIDV